MKIYLYGRGEDKKITRQCEQVILEEGFPIVSELSEADLAIAPYLTRKISRKDRLQPTLGTLIFHPSLLPIHRGRDAIKWAFRLGETYSGATWFFADDGYDTGDICEMEVLRIRENERPRTFYEETVIPAGVRMLRTILTEWKAGVLPRRRIQQEEHATYEPPI